MNSVPGTETLPTNPTEERTANALAKVGIGPGSKITAFVPTSLDETWRLATIIAKSGMAPKAYGSSAEKVMVGIIAGLELGLTPFTALQSIAVIGNNPTVWGDGALALVEASGLLEYHEEVFEQATETATCTVKRLGKPTPTVRTFSFDDAKKAKLLGKDGPWQGYPKRMCQMRARAFALRDTFADVLKGMGIAEEVRDWAGESSGARAHADNRLSSAMLFEQAGQGEVIEGAAQTTAQAIDDDLPANLKGNPFAPAGDDQPTNDGTLSADNPTAAEGPADDQRGEANTGAEDEQPIWIPHFDALRQRILKATTVIDVNNLETEALNMAQAIPDDAGETLVNDIAAARARLSKKG